MNIKPLFELVDILRKEQGLTKYSFIEMKSYKDGVRFKSPHKNPYYDTSEVRVTDKGITYILTDKTVISLNIIRSKSGKEWPLDYQFDKIEKRILTMPDLKPYQTDRSYKEWSGDGTYSMVKIYSKDGVDYGI